MVYVGWGHGYLKKRKEKKAREAEEGIAMRKLGGDGSEFDLGGEVEGEGAGEEGHRDGAEERTRV